MHERAIYPSGGQSGGAGHLDLEDLAALIDGPLPPEEAASARAHLARCEPCLALFAETASFLRDDREAEGIDHVEVAAVAAQPAAAASPLPFTPREEPRPLAPLRRPRRRRWAAVAAAAAVLAAATLLYQHRELGRPQVDVARLLASLAGRQSAIAALYWGPVERGASAGPDERSLASFRLGVELVNLDAALAVGDSDHAASAATHVNGLLEHRPVGIDIKRFFRGLPARIQSGAPPASFAGELAAARRDLEGYLSQPDYDFGRWTEAGRLAAAAGAPDFLMAQDIRRFPGALRGDLKHTLNPRAGAALDAIAKILDRDALTAEDLKTLDARFQEILQTYYPV